MGLAPKSFVALTTIAILFKMSMPVGNSSAPLAVPMRSYGESEGLAARPHFLQLVLQSPVFPLQRFDAQSQFLHRSERNAGGIDDRDVLVGLPECIFAGFQDQGATTEGDWSELRTTGQRRVSERRDCCGRW